MVVGGGGRVEPFASGGGGTRGRGVVEMEGADPSYQAVETDAAHEGASVLFSVM